ncbi:DUF308 domain-containing protein [Spirosoma migulaei]
MNLIKPKPSLWWIRYMHDISYALMGMILLIHPTKASPLTTGLLGGLLLLAGLSTSWLSMRRRQLNQPNDYRLLLSSVRDTLFGVMLLANLGKATNRHQFIGNVGHSVCLPASP